MRRRRRRIPNSRSRSAGFRCANLIADLFDSRTAYFVEYGNHIAVAREHGRADRNFDAGICLMQFVKLRQNLVIRHVLSVEVNRISLTDLDGKEIFLGRRWGGSRRGQSDLNAFHVGLAQAHHHETGQEEEHDVDQRNDLDTCALAWNR